MSHVINPLVIDLSHWDPADDYQRVKAAGIVGVIFKASQGSSNADSAYPRQRIAAEGAGLLWGAYHFGDSSNVKAQVANFIGCASPKATDLIALDFEDNGDNSMSLEAAKEFVVELEAILNRKNECVLYSGNRIKERMHVIEPFWSAHRLWLAQYSDKPVAPISWTKAWLWQFTDGKEGPLPHTVPGVKGTIDINSYDGTPEQLKAEWASGKAALIPPVPPPLAAAPAEPQQIVTITIDAPPGVKVQVVQTNI